MISKLRHIALAACAAWLGAAAWAQPSADFAREVEQGAQALIQAIDSQRAPSERADEAWAANMPLAANGKAGAQARSKSKAQPKAKAKAKARGQAAAKTGAKAKAKGKPQARAQASAKTRPQAQSKARAKAPAQRAPTLSPSPAAQFAAQRGSSAPAASPETAAEAVAHALGARAFEAQAAEDANEGIGAVYETGEPGAPGEAETVETESGLAEGEAFAPSQNAAWAGRPGPLPAPDAPQGFAVAAGQGGPAGFMPPRLPPEIAAAFPPEGRNARPAARAGMNRPAKDDAAGPKPFSAAAAPMTSQRLFDYGERNKARLRDLLSRALRGQSVSIRIVQFGDSHTAGEFFTQRARERLQSIFGAGSVGWIPPAKVTYQRNSLADYAADGWSMLSSKSDYDPDFPMGGYISFPSRDNASLKISPKKPIRGRVPIKVLVRRSVDLGAPVVVGSDGQRASLNAPADGRWHIAMAILATPVTFVADMANQYQLGGVWIDDETRGVSLSSVGLNGAQQVVWDKWGSGWMTLDLAESSPDAIFIQYGTNEAFNDRLDINKVRQSYLNRVRQLRRLHPRAAIVIIGAPDSLRRSGQNSILCSNHRPRMLDYVKMAERSVAITTRSIYWDWQSAMGGKCSMENWLTQGLAAKDGVHLSEAGYRKSADLFVSDLLDWMSFTPR